MNRLWKFIKRHKIITGVVVVVLVIAGFIIVRQLNKDPLAGYAFATVQRGELVQQVSVTGKVKSAQEIQLAFQTSGRVASVNGKIGDTVKEGTVLASLSNAEMSAQLSQAQANYEAEVAQLLELKKGTRPEEVASAQTKVDNAQRTLTDADNDLTLAKSKAEVDLGSAYDAVLTETHKAVNAGKSALLTLTDIQYAHFNGSGQEDLALADAKAKAVSVLLGADNAGRWSNSSLSVLIGGAYGLVQDALDDPTTEKVNTAISESLHGLQLLQDVLNMVPVTSELTTTEATNLASERSSIASELNLVSTKQQAISSQMETNQKNIASAQSAITTAQNNLASAQDDLNLKLAGSTPEQIAAQQARVKSALSTVQNYQAQLEKTIIRAPIDGVIASKDVKFGEVVSANAPAMTLLSQAQFQIEANIPEVDVAKVKIGNQADVTLDAYGSSQHFPAEVVGMDLSETVVEGVPTYKTILHFLNNDDRIKSGMTANVDITTQKLPNVLIVPQRAVVSRDNKNYAKILEPDKKFLEVEVGTGVKGTNRDIEITSGLTEGQQVVVFEVQ